ncbi:MAG TPA: ATP-grasp domain-containing protein [Sedimentisphaerales bacterium]|jgi:D-alanine-D-alanine ligase|nr:ATP-grasp domain-containing protein [Sedimentisphaerales bacterium]HNU30972.1 ATP-grasp domain-containing protein [Sedimentisphaerales bacterium]
MTVGLVYDLRDDYLAQGFTQEQAAEFDSAATIDALEKAIRSLGYATERIGNGMALAQQLAAGNRWDLVFNIAEGLYGRSREAQTPALLEMYGIPYTCSDPLVCALTLDKAMTKRVLQSAGLHTPRFAVVTSPSQVESLDLDYPLFAKPLAEGTGKGVDKDSRVDSPAALEKVCARLLERFAEPVLVEEYLPGREFTTAILGTGCDARVLGTIEFRIEANAPAQDYSFDVKEQCEQCVTYFPMPKGALRDEAEALALAAYRVLECRDTGRVDIRLDAQGRPAFIEINPLPGMHPTHSDLPMIATQEGMSYEELIGSIVHSALARQESTPCSAGKRAS